MASQYEKYEVYPLGPNDHGYKYSVVCCAKDGQPPVFTFKSNKELLDFLSSI